MASDGFTGAGVAVHPRASASHHESADDYDAIVARVCESHRVITCKNGLQWILQHREGERHGRARWGGVGYFRTRKALIRASRASCARIDPAALATLAALPEHFVRVGG